MKKIIALLVTLSLLLGLSSVALAKPNKKSPSKTLPEYSSYQFDYTLPDRVLATKDTVVGVNLKTSTLGQNGLDKAYIKFSATGPGNVSFAPTNTAAYINQGILTSFDLPAQYNVNTNWLLNFSQRGTYQVTFQLFNNANVKVAEKVQEFKVVNGYFTFSTSEKVYATGDTSLGVTLTTGQDYSNVHLAFAKTAGTGNVVLSSQDTDGTWYASVDSGNLKPSNFNLTASYNRAAVYKTVFTIADTYKINFKLLAADGTVLVEDTAEINVQNPPSMVDDDDDDDDDDDRDDNEGKKNGKGNTHGLLNAVRNHLKFKKNGKLPSKSNSLNRLMELLEERGLSKDLLDNLKDAIEELEDAITEMEAAIAGNFKATDDEDFKALSKMKKLQGKKYETYINGKKIKYDDVEPILLENRTLVPFRKLGEILGADVSWNQEKQEITMTKANKKVVITIDKNTATIDGKTVTLDVPAKLHKNRTLVPLRFLAEAFDTTVDYYPEGSLITIKNK